MAKASRKLPASTGNIIHTGARLDGESNLIARKPVVAERGEFSKSAAKSNHKRHLEKAQDELRKAQDAAELGDYLDEIAAPGQFKSFTPTPAATKKGRGRPGAKKWAQTETRRCINDGEVTPTQDGLTNFCRQLLVPRWNQIRGLRRAVTAGTFANNVRDIWRDALNARK